jgi:ectoine hydroxylase-related dioxygenase (phytanoyl-CoA dioxygenase family)
MSPFDTSSVISFWIPLQNIPHPDYGALPYWNGIGGVKYAQLEFRYGGGGRSSSKNTGSSDDDDIFGGGGVRHHMPLKVGDVTLHNGWTLHCANASEDYLASEDRYALLITFVVGRAEVQEDALSSSSSTSAAVAKDDKEDVWSFCWWVSDVMPRTN